MNFNELVVKQLWPILKKNSFLLTEQHKNVIHFCKNQLEIILAYNELDKLSQITIGNSEWGYYPLNNNLLRKVFNSASTIDDVTKEIFVNNLAAFFENEGSSILSQDHFILKEIKQYTEEANIFYTKQILNNQKIEAATNAWAKKDYKYFIEIIEGMEYDNLPESFRLKYKIAKKK